MSKKDGYFTIGEISKITGVNPKSIRYYDRIGVLPPAFADSETGYRYYQPSQLGIISAIQVCVELGIPLNSFSDYCSDKAINAAHFLKDASEISKQKIQALEESLKFIQELEEQIKHSDELVAAGQKAEHEFPRQQLIVEEIQPDISLADFNKVIGKLHTTALQLGIRCGLQFGRMAFFSNRQIQKLYAICSVRGDTEGANTITLPKQYFTAIHSTKTQIENAPQLFPDYFASGSDIVVLETEMITGTYNPQTPNYEIRCAYKSNY